MIIVDDLVQTGGTLKECGKVWLLYIHILNQFDKRQRFLQVDVWRELDVVSRNNTEFKMVKLL